MLTTHILLFLSWVLYGVLHSLFASVSLKKWVQQHSGFVSKYYRLFYSVFAFASLILLLWFQFSIKSILLFEAAWLRFAIGLPLACIGAVIMLVCSKNYFLHMLGIEVFFNQDTAPVLKIDGLHRYVRHPLYLGTFIFIIGLFCYFPFLSNLIATAVIIAYTLIGIRWEERKLVLEFGEQYRAYQNKVPMLIPFF